MKNPVPRPLLVVIILGTGFAAALPFQTRKLGNAYDTGKASLDDLNLRRQLPLELSQQSNGFDASVDTAPERSNGSATSPTPYRPPAVWGRVGPRAATIDGIAPAVIGSSRHDAIQPLRDMDNGQPGPPEMSPQYRRVGSIGYDDSEKATGTNGAWRSQVTNGPRREPAPESENHQASGRPSRAVRRHTVVDGDSLQTIARKYLGSRDAYLEIYALNRNVLARPDVLPLGVELTIPSRPTSTTGR